MQAIYHKQDKIVRVYQSEKIVWSYKSSPIVVYSSTSFVNNVNLDSGYTYLFDLSKAGNLIYSLNGAKQSTTVKDQDKIKIPSNATNAKFTGYNAVTIYRLPSGGGYVNPLITIFAATFMRWLHE